MKVIEWVYPKLERSDFFNCYRIGMCTEANYNEYYEDAIIKELVDNKYIICGDTHQYKCVPIFDDNTYVLLSMRKWGEIMAKAMNLIEGLDKYTYKDFYLINLCKMEEKLPIK